MASQFEKDDKFTGRIHENVNDSIANYMRSAVDYEPRPAQKLRLIYNVSDVKARYSYIKQRTVCLQYVCRSVY